MTPKIRQWIYTAAAVASALIPLLVAYKVLDTDVAGAWVNLIGFLGALGTGGATTAAVVTARQRKEGTLDFTGTAPQQAVEAIRATVARSVGATADLQSVIRAASDMLANTPVFTPPSPPAPTSGSSDPSRADYIP